MFASFDYFKNKLIEKTDLDPFALREQQKRFGIKAHSSMINSAQNAIKNVSSPSPSEPHQTRNLQPTSRNGVVEHNAGSSNQNAEVKPEDQVAKMNNSSDIHTSADGNASQCSLQTNKTEDEVPVTVDRIGEQMEVEISLEQKEGDKTALDTLQKNAQMENRTIVLDGSVWAFIDDTGVQRLIDERQLLYNKIT